MSGLISSLYLFPVEEGDQFISGISKILVRRDERDDRLFLSAVGILFESRVDNPNLTLNPGHEAFDQFGRTVSDTDLFLFDSAILSAQQGVNAHSRGILPQ